MTRALALCALLELSAACAWRSSSSGAVHVDEHAQVEEHEEHTTTAPVREETTVERWTVTPGIGRALPRGGGPDARPPVYVEGPQPPAPDAPEVPPADPYVFEREHTVVDLAPVDTTTRTATAAAASSSSSVKAAATRADVGTGLALHIAIACVLAGLAALAWRFRRSLPVVGPLFPGGDK